MLTRDVIMLLIILSSVNADAWCHHAINYTTLLSKCWRVMSSCY